MSNKYLVAFLALNLCFSSVDAYELATHARLTNQAYKGSVLADSQLIDQFGIKNGKNPFGFDYYDVSGSQIEVRKIDLFEQDKDRMPKGSEPLSIAGWLMRGAIREDDVCPYSPCDAPNNMIRVLNHFFDPVKDRPLTIGIALGAKATDWATGLQDTYANPALPDTTRANHFSLLDAREAMWRALTGRDRAGNTKIGPGQTAATETVRKAYWATTFRALGDVLHLVQDMSQPQHTRNDVHLVNGRVGKTLYEAFTDARAKGEQFKCFNGVRKPVPPLTYGNYVPVEFDQYGQFFSSFPGSVSSGTGIADYSHRSFFTAGTSIGTTTYTSPATDATVYATKSTVTPDPCANPGKFAPRELLVVGGIADQLNPAYIDTDHNATPYSNNNPVPLSTRGVWRVRKPGPNKNNFYVDKEGYGLSDDNYLAMGNHLIPRAVGYSAGLINYFFRGRLSLEIDQYSGGQASLKVGNLTPKDTLYSVDRASNPATLMLVYEYTSGQDTVFGAADNPVDMDSGDDVGPEGSSASSYTFTFSNPIPASAKRSGPQKWDSGISVNPEVF